MPRRHSVQGCLSRAREPSDHQPTRANADRQQAPANFKYAGLIHLALPNARIIHVRPDPLDTCFSCFSLLFSGDQPFTYDLGELGRCYLGYATPMEHWRSVLPHGVMIDVQHEDLVADLDGQARAIVDHCGLEWEDACLAFHNTQRQGEDGEFGPGPRTYLPDLGRALAPLREFFSGH